MLLSARGDNNEHILDVALQEKQGHNIFDAQEAVVLPGNVQQQ